MFEKEAEKYADKQIGCGDGYYEWTDVKQSFKDGAEFGYKLAHEEMDYLNKHWGNGKDKANEWHYVKDELPRKSDSTLCELIPVFVAVKVGYHIETYGTYWNLKLGKFECLDEVYAWCYTPEPPELPKESD